MKNLAFMAVFVEQISGMFKFGSLLLLDLTSRLPLGFRYLITGFFSFLVFVISHKRRNSVKRNLKIILNRKPSVLQILRVFFEYGKYWAELFSINQIWTSSVKVYHNPGFPPVEKCFLGITFHIGNFEMFGRILTQVSHDYFNVIAERLRPQYIADIFKRIRNRHCIKTIPHDELRQVINVLKSGKSLGVLCDRMIGGRGIEVRIFGKHTRMPLNIVDFALQRKIPVYIAYCINNSGVLNIYSRKIDEKSDFEGAVNTVISTLEESVIRDPYQWHLLDEL